MKTKEMWEVEYKRLEVFMHRFSALVQSGLSHPPSFNPRISLNLLLFSLGMKLE